MFESYTGGIRDEINIESKKLKTKREVKRPVVTRTCVKNAAERVNEVWCA